MNFYEKKVTFTNICNTDFRDNILQVEEVLEQRPAAVHPALPGGQEQAQLNTPGLDPNLMNPNRTSVLGEVVRLYILSIFSNLPCYNIDIETTQRLRCRQHLLSLTEINLDQLQLLLATPDEGPGPHPHVVQLAHCYGYAVGLDGRHRLGELVMGEDFQKGHGVSLSEGRHKGSEGIVMVAV